MTDLPSTDAIYAALEDLRARRPLVHNITNYVAMTVSANVLLALGASPAMVHAVEEVEDFAAISDALVVNIGTLSPAWVAAMHAAVARAKRARQALGARSGRLRRYPLSHPGGGRAGGAVACGHPRQCQRDHEPGRAGGGGRQGRRFERASRGSDRRGRRTGRARRMRGRRHRRHRLCQRRRQPRGDACRPCADAAVDRARLRAQRRHRRLHRGAAAARGGDRRACRVRRRRQPWRPATAAVPATCRRNSATRSIAWTGKRSPRAARITA